MSVELVIALVGVAFLLGVAFGHLTTKARRQPTSRSTLPSRTSGTSRSVILPPSEVAGSLTDQVRQTIGTSIAEGRTIEAIKIYREATGVGLKDAKDAIDRWKQYGRPSGPEFPTQL